MPVAYSNLPIVKGTIRSDTPANLVSDLDAILTAAGWATKSTVTGGFKYTITSPDGFQAKVLIINGTGYSGPYTLYPAPSVVVQFMGFDESNKGFPHQLRHFGAGNTHQVIAGICQLFISVPGSTVGWGSVAGGIPAQPANSGPCLDGIASVTVTDLWWSCGGSQFSNDFRKSANCYGSSTYCYNGVMVVAPDDNSVDSFDGRLCLFPLTAVNTYLSGQLPSPAITYLSHVPLNIDAFVGWVWQIRGQIWDAFLQTAAVTLDSIDTFEDIDATGTIVNVQAIAWYSEFFSSLRLIFGNPTAGAGGNVAF